MSLPITWWIGRSAGLLAYAALWLALLFGVLVGSRGGGGWLDKATVFELHRAWSLLALLATAVHVLALTLDPASGVPTLAALVPLVSPRLTGPVAVGTVALWGLVAVGATTAARARLAPWVWRAVHATAFGAFALALVHAVTAGTATGLVEVRVAYAATGAVLLGVTLQRAALASAGRAAG